MNLPHRHAAGVERQDLVVEARPAGLVLGDELRLECAVSVAGNLDRQFAEVPFQRLPAFAIAGIAGRIGDRFILGVAQVLGHFRFKRALHQHLGELL